MVNQFRFYQNCCGLRMKLFDFNCNIAYINCIFIISSETWLDDSNSDSELILFNYKLYRCDKNTITSSYLRGEDVLLAVRKNFTSKIILPVSNIEYIIVQAFIGL